MSILILLQVANIDDILVSDGGPAHARGERRSPGPDCLALLLADRDGIAVSGQAGADDDWSGPSDPAAPLVVVWDLGLGHRSGLPFLRETADPGGLPMLAVVADENDACCPGRRCAGSPTLQRRRRAPGRRRPGRGPGPAGPRRVLCTDLPARLPRSTRRADRTPDTPRARSAPTPLPGSSQQANRPAP